MQFSRVIIKYEKIHTYKCTNIADMMASKRFKNRIAHIEVEMQIQNEQDPVSTMQKTGLTNYSSFLIWSGLEKLFTLEVITGSSNDLT